MSSSPPASFVGYSWFEYLKRNKAELKLLVSAAGGVGAWWLSQHAFAQEVSMLLGTLATCGLHMAMSAVDYWLTDQPGAPEPTEGKPQDLNGGAK